MKTLLSIYVVAVVLLLSACGEPPPESTSTPLTLGLHSYVGSMTCPSEGATIAVIQLATFARVNVWGLGQRYTVQLGPYPSGRQGVAEMTLSCPTVAVLDETAYHANIAYLNCRVLTHPASDQTWAITGQIQIAPGRLEFIPPDSIHPLGYVSIWQALPTPHWDTAHGLCAVDNDSIVMQ